MEAGLRKRVGEGVNGVSVRRSFDGRLYGQSWETPFIGVPDGPITGERRGDDRGVQREYARRYGNRFESRCRA